MPDPCCHCKRIKDCQAAPKLIMAALFAAGREETIPPCPFKEEDFYHGIEGVYA